MLSTKNTLLKGFFLISLLAAAPAASQSPEGQPTPVLRGPVPYEQILAEEAEAAASLREVNKTEVNCLARNIYYEARGEGVNGMRAVAYVTMNRMESRLFSNTVCGVVHQPHQFSWVRAGYGPPRGPMWTKAQEIAEAVYTGADASDNTGGATYFHATTIKPRWAYRLTHTVTIGGHAFYRN